MSIRRILAFLVLVLLPLQAHAATGTIMPSPVFIGLDDNGVIIPGGLLYAYAAGTVTPQNTFSNAALTSANAHPIVLSAAGRATVFLTPGLSYKFLLKTAAGVTVYTQDNIFTVPASTVDLDVTGTAGEALLAGDSVYLSDGSGALTAGRWYKTDSDNTYSSTTAQAIGFAVADIASAAAGSIRIAGKVTGLAGLAAGSVYYISATAGAITSSAPTNQRAVGVADSGTTLVISSGTTAAAASATQAGVVSLATQTLGTGTKSVDRLDFKPGGTTTFGARACGSLLGPFITEKATTGTTAESMIATPPAILANTLNAAGDWVRASWYGIASGHANPTHFTVNLGGTQQYTCSFTPNAAAASWRLTVDIMRMATSTAQQVNVMLTWGEGAVASGDLGCMGEVAGTKDMATELTLDALFRRETAGTLTFKRAHLEFCRGS